MWFLFSCISGSNTQSENSWNCVVVVNISTMVEARTPEGTTTRRGGGNIPNGEINMQIYQIYQMTGNKSSYSHKHERASSIRLNLFPFWPSADFPWGLSGYSHARISHCTWFILSFEFMWRTLSSVTSVYRLLHFFILITVILINATLCWFVGSSLAVFHCVWPDSAVRL